jgi:hypothetical protein
MSTIVFLFAADDGITATTGTLDTLVSVTNGEIVKEIVCISRFPFLAPDPTPEPTPVPLHIWVFSTTVIEIMQL